MKPKYRIRMSYIKDGYWFIFKIIDPSKIDTEEACFSPWIA